MSPSLLWAIFVVTVLVVFVWQLYRRDVAEEQSREERSGTPESPPDAVQAAPTLVKPAGTVSSLPPRPPLPHDPDLARRLSHLADLREKGLISAREFEAKSRRLLDEL